MKWVRRTRGGGKGEEWEVGSVKHAYKVFPSNLYGLQCAIWSRCPVFKRAFSCRGAANPGIRPGEPLRPTDTQHMCSLARALREGGEWNGEERQRSRRVRDEEQGVGDSDGAWGGWQREKNKYEKANLDRQSREVKK